MASQLKFCRPSSTSVRTIKVLRGELLDDGSRAQAAVASHGSPASVRATAAATWDRCVEQEALGALSAWAIASRRPLRCSADADRAGRATDPAPGSVASGPATAARDRAGDRPAGRAAAAPLCEASHGRSERLPLSVGGITTRAAGL